MPPLIKRRIWDEKINKRRTHDAALIRAFPYNREKHYKTILKLTERCKLFHDNKGVRSLP